MVVLAGRPSHTCGACFRWIYTFVQHPHVSGQDIYEDLIPLSVQAPVPAQNQAIILIGSPATPGAGTAKPCVTCNATLSRAKTSSTPGNAPCCRWPIITLDRCLVQASPPRCHAGRLPPPVPVPLTKLGCPCLGTPPDFTQPDRSEGYIRCRALSQSSVSTINASIVSLEFLTCNPYHGSSC